jgi:hypothetical protein
MSITRSEVTKEIFAELNDLPTSRLREILGYVSFIKFKDTIDPRQAYFWTKRWQARERKVEEDKRKGRIIGNGTVRGLVRELRK